MINVYIKQAYEAARKATDAPYLRQILSFKKVYGFFFGTSKTETEYGASYILVDKNDVANISFLPMIPDNLDFIESGMSVPLTTVK